MSLGIFYFSTSPINRLAMYCIPLYGNIKYLKPTLHTFYTVSNVNKMQEFLLN